MRLRLHSSVGVVCCAIPCLLLAWSCSGTSTEPMAREPSEAPGAPAALEQAGGSPCVAAEHAVHSERLRQIMAGLSRQVARVWPQEIADDRAAELKDRRAATFTEAAQLSAALASAAGCIPNATASVQLTPAERDDFLRYVQALRGQADNLRTSAAARDERQMRAALRAINGTCQGCHHQFRQLAGPLRGSSGLP